MFYFFLKYDFFLLIRLGLRNQIVLKKLSIKNLEMYKYISSFATKI